MAIDLSGLVGHVTLPLLASTQMACFLSLMPREPAKVAVTVEGRVWRSPGPSLSACFGLEGTGRMLAGSSSPGRTMVGALILYRDIVFGEARFAVPVAQVQIIE